MLPFEHWLPLHRLAVAALLPRLGDFPAVYALRDAATGDILKFGNAGQLRQRIFGNYLGGVGGSTTMRIHHALFSETWIERVELAWLQTHDKSEAERRERECRTLYKREYRRRPLWDLQG